MLSKDISKKILTIGPDNSGEGGGISSILNTYKNFVYSTYYFEKSTSSKGKLFSLLALAKLFYMIPYYVFVKKIQVIHFHGASENSFKRKRLLIYYSFLFPVKLIYHLHGGNFKVFTERYGIKKVKNTFYRCERVIVLSDMWENYINTEIGYLKTSIINNVIPEPDYICPTNIHNNILTFMFLGLLNDQKGIFDLINLIVSNKNYFEGRIKLIIGGMGEVNRLNKIITDYRLDKIVEFVGWINGKEKEHLFNHSDIFILPSYIEALPISILEAMSYGKAIISTNVGSIPTLVKHGQNGFLFNPGNLDELKGHINSFLYDRSIIKNFGSYSEIIIKDYFPEFVSIQLEKMYNNVFVSH